MFYLWVLHYSLVKGIYKKRWKEMTTSADALAFACLFLLSFFVFMLFVDKELFWDIIRKRLPLGPMAKGILVLLTPILIFMLSGRLTKQKIKTIRKVVKLKNGIKRIYSILYVVFFVILFFGAFLIGILSRTPI
jgi:hypothetical protein